MFRIFLAFLTLLAGFTNFANADWIYEQTSTLCSEEARLFVAQNTRNQIESSVFRSEASIQPPQSIESLSCLSGLMNLQIADFSPPGLLQSLFKRSLDNVPRLNGNGFERLCAYAKQEWQRRTSPLKSRLGEAFGGEYFKSNYPARDGPNSLISRQ